MTEAPAAVPQRPVSRRAQGAGRGVLTVVRVTAMLLAVVLLAGCSGDDGTGDAAPEVDRDQIVAALVDDVIVPGYTELASTTDELATATAELCATPSTEAFDAAREAWDRAQGAWSSTAAYRLGPIRPLRLTARIEYPIDIDKIDALAADVADPAPVTPQAIAELGADVRGLDTVQHLLFTPSDVGGLSTRQCAYAASAAALAAAAAEELRVAWVDGTDGEAPAAEQMTEPGGDSMWASSTEVLEDVLNSSLAALTTVADMQLGAASGATADPAEPEVVDDGAAHRALADIADELRSVQAVYGDSSAAAPSGLSALVAAAATSTSDQAIRTDLGAAVDAVESVPPPLADVDPDDADSPPMRALVQGYQHALAARSALGTEVASLLGLTISFSDSDGDS